MRRIFLTVLLSFALVAGALASASAAFACPNAPAASHECCPDEGAGNQGGDDKPSMMDCPFVNLCRTAPAVASTAAPVLAPQATTILADAPRVESAPASAPTDGLFRPPRTL